MLDFLLFISPEELRGGVERLYYEHNDDLIRFAKSLLWRKGWKSYEQDSADVVQRAYLKLMKCKKIDFSKSDKEIVSYAIAATQSAAYEFMKETMVFEEFCESNYYPDIADDDFFERLQIKHKYETVVEAVKEMDLIYSTTLMFKMQGWTITEIAKYMGVPEQTVYTRNRRAKNELLKKVEDMDL